MDEKYTNIKERLLYFAKNQSIGVENFLDNIGMTYGSFKGKAKEGSLNSNAIAEIYTKYPVMNIDWLLTGQGSMLKSNTDQLPASGKMIPGNVGIPLIPIEAMAGYGGGETQIMEYEGERFMVPTFQGADFLIQVKGSSMYPKYNSGDIVACKKLHLNDVFFQWNKVYVLDTEQGALIKRIDIAHDDDHVMIVSDNEKYKPFPLHKSRINAISIVMGVIRLE